MTAPLSFEMNCETRPERELLARATLLAKRIADGDRRIAASKRAARIVDRVLPLLPAGVPKFDDLGGFFDRSARVGQRNALYATIYARLLAKPVHAAQVAAETVEDDRRDVMGLAA